MPNVELLQFYLQTMSDEEMLNQLKKKWPRANRARQLEIMHTLAMSVCCRTWRDCTTLAPIIIGDAGFTIIGE